MVCMALRLSPPPPHNRLLYCCSAVHVVITWSPTANQQYYQKSTLSRLWPSFQTTLNHCHMFTGTAIGLVSRITIDIVGCVTSQRARPSPQAQSYLLESCPVSKWWFVVLTQLKQMIPSIRSFFIPWSCRHCQIFVLSSLVRQGRPLSHVAGCRRRDLTSTFRGGRVQNERMRPSHTWREPGRKCWLVR